MTAVLVFLGAMIGAPLRYLTDRAVQTRHDSLFPWGTFSVNVAGCLVLGGLAGAGSALPGTLVTVLPPRKATRIVLAGSSRCLY
ncbi:fluoride efflux transporter FluC [Kibdelosporangium aridum]|uniref:Fluoride-specific ion channel n=1 Tax=Kibdelosporangium aridum TaxID=2030 RepID=A0A1W2FX37_KIBAR|nr:CrcB-like protein, Camphor Resistance (CrcB) [Kibdelosporangium aridum]